MSSESVACDDLEIRTLRFIVTGELIESDNVSIRIYVERPSHSHGSFTREAHMTRAAESSRQTFMKGPNFSARHHYKNVLACLQVPTLG